MAYIPRNPYFSEFSFGYAVTEDLVGAAGAGVTIAPVFPSLIEEGNRGYDVMIGRPGIPLFLQFKLAHCMKRGTARETKAGLLTPPFYRMYLRCGAISNQHSLLLDLERDGNEVYYVAPGFHRTQDLDDAYQRHQVWNRSFHLRPTQIGDLDSSDHHVSFHLPGTWHVFSDKQRRSGETPQPQEWLKTIQARLRSGDIRPVSAQLQKLDHSIMKIFRERKDEIIEWKPVSVDRLETDLRPIQRVSYLARIFFDCQFMIATETAS